MSDSNEHISLNNVQSGDGNDFTKASEMSSDEKSNFISVNNYDKDVHGNSSKSCGITEDDIIASVTTGKRIVDKIPNHEMYHASSKAVFWGQLPKLTNNSSYDSLVVTDTDPDGKAVAALYKYKYGDDAISLPASYRYGVEPLEALRKLTDFIEPDITVYLCDIGPNKEQKDEWIRVIDELQQTNPIRIRDHHERVDEIYDAFDEMENVEYVLDQEVCATVIVLREDIHNPSQSMVELAAITNVQDMHIPNSPHFDEWVPKLRMASRALSFSRYVDSASEKGISFLKDDTYDDYFEKYEYMMAQQEKHVLDTLDTITVGGFKIGFVYGDSHPDQPAEIMKQKHNCDIACLLKPNGRMSIRSDLDTAPFSHEIAEEFGGGGHADSAGCVVFEMYDSEPPIPKEEHYETKGSEQRKVVEEVIREIISEK